MINKENIEEKEYIAILTELMYIISHKMRKPLCNIVGLLALNKELIDSGEEQVSVDLLKESAEELDVYTREMSSLIYSKKRELIDCMKVEK